MAVELGLSLAETETVLDRLVSEGLVRPATQDECAGLTSSHVFLLTEEGRKRAQKLTS